MLCEKIFGYLLRRNPEVRRAEERMLVDGTEILGSSIEVKPRSFCRNIMHSAYDWKTYQCVQKKSMMRELGATYSRDLAVYEYPLAYDDMDLSATRTAPACTEEEQDRGGKENPRRAGRACWYRSGLTDDKCLRFSSWFMIDFQQAMLKKEEGLKV